MTSDGLLAALDRSQSSRVLVVGDAILDRYTWGVAERISPEAPVLVLHAQRREPRLGGAANVCQMLRGLEAQATFVGVVGDDEAGSILRQNLLDANISTYGVFHDPSRPTTVKERFIGCAGSGHPSQILRVDQEQCHPLDRGLEDELAGVVEAHARDHDVLLISDYAKGVCTPRLLERIIAAARRAGIPVVVDPRRGTDFSCYRGATAIKPNRREAELATGLTLVHSDDALAAGAKLCRQVGSELAVITLDRDGIALVRADGSGEIFPTDARNVYDITGAGDMVMATLGAALGCGTSPEDAVRLSNIAAGLEVERTGVAIVTRDEIRRKITGRTAGTEKIISRQDAARRAAQLRRAGRRIVFTNGCFDLLHVGHVTYLTEAASLGDALFVGLNSDESVRRLKGEGRPVIAERDRAAMLAALGGVDHVVIFDEDTPQALLESVRPDVLVKGGTYRPEEIVGYDLVTGYGGEVRVTGMVEGVSTTNLLRSLHPKRFDAAEPVRKAG